MQNTLSIIKSGQRNAGSFSVKRQKVARGFKGTEKLIRTEVRWSIRRAADRSQKISFISIVSINLGFQNIYSLKGKNIVARITTVDLENVVDFKKNLTTKVVKYENSS
ncbi:hypothetical protein SUGI_1016000 [Cryptomeria japonica]|nr:hypothetical protein SUGI_1016000 [Cryptomeria japonica]